MIGGQFFLKSYYNTVDFFDRLKMSVRHFFMRYKMKKIILSLIAVLFILVTVYGEEFNDVKRSDRYYNTVTYMSEKGFLSGYDDGNFKPDTAITSAEFISIVCRIKEVSPKVSSSEHWAGGLMESALDMGWYDYDENPPTGEKYNKPIERQLAVKIIMKAFAGNINYDYNTESAKINDFNTLSGRYYDTVLGAYKEGIVNGDNKGNFNPTRPLTRAEACTLIKRAMDIYSVDAEIITECTTLSMSVNGGISENGALQVKGTQLLNEGGERVVLKGMSSHGLQWFPQFTDSSYIKAIADRGANVMRFAMYTEENGYIQNSSVKNVLIKGVDNTLALDMYAIIDWHILSDGNPMTHINEAESFFSEIAERYKESKGVIYEICNEPNGNIIWSNDVKPYAERIIATIRSIDSDCIILVGNPQWCQDLDSVVNAPLDFNNIMYTCHFYAGTHGQWLRDKISNALNNNIPVFISEWGTGDAGGGGGVYDYESREWIEFMNNNNLSWCNWSLCDKNESSAALIAGADSSDGLEDSELSESGKIVFNSFK